MDRNVVHVCIVLIPEYMEDVTLSTGALVSRAYTSVNNLLSLGTQAAQKGNSITMTSLQHITDPV